MLSESGKDNGEIDNVGRQGYQVVAVVGVGGFLGIGEHPVALPLDQPQYANDQIVLPQKFEADLRDMPEYETAQSTSPTRTPASATSPRNSQTCGDRSMRAAAAPLSSAPCR